MVEVMEALEVEVTAVGVGDMVVEAMVVVGEEVVMGLEEVVGEAIEV